MQASIFDSRDIPNPESRAVLQALSSRSLDSMRNHIDRVNQDKTENFISVNCIGYGHDSVLENADSIIIHVSGVSMLTAKAIEDFSRFKGTEASTRYINVTSLPFVTAYGTDFENKLMRKHFDFFDRFYPLVVEELFIKFPNTALDSKTQLMHDKAIKAKAFDISRCWLPAGASTVVNWATDIRSLKDHLTMLLAHPLTEIQEVAFTIMTVAKEKYPASFERFPNREHVRFISENALEYFYFTEEADYGPTDVWSSEKYSYQQIDICYNADEIDIISEDYTSLFVRPRGCPAPRMYVSNFNIAGLMDFGSFRDIQRHRNGKCKMPILEANSFETWYLDQLSPELREVATTHRLEIEVAIKEFRKGNSALATQYLIPFGYRVPYLLEYSFEQMIYVAELRSSKHVHPTCRVVAQATDDFISEKLPFVNLHTDRSDTQFDARRGNHDINIPGAG